MARIGWGENARSQACAGAGTRIIRVNSTSETTITRRVISVIHILLSFNAQLRFGHSDCHSP
jgi:hypothetical protein